MALIGADSFPLHLNYGFQLLLSIRLKRQYIETTDTSQTPASSVEVEMRLIEAAD